MLYSEHIFYQNTVTAVRETNIIMYYLFNVASFVVTSLSLKEKLTIGLWMFYEFN